MDKKKSILNVSISIISRVILLLVALVVRRLLIQKIGNEANGLNSLYSSIIGTLSVVELGVGRAMTGLGAEVMPLSQMLDTLAGWVAENVGKDGGN